MSPFMEKRFLPRRTAGREEKERLSKVIAVRIAQEPDVLFAFLHGSFVTGESFRDIDVGIYMERGKDFSYDSDLSYGLSKATGYEVEVKVINEAPVAFQMTVLQNGRLLFSRNDDAKAAFIEDVGRRYREYAHFRNIFMEAVGAE